jgi:hypothetical protein
MRRVGLLERYAFLTFAALLVVPGQVWGDGAAGGTALGTHSRSTMAPELEAGAAGSERSCGSAPDGGTSGSSGFAGSVRAPLFINKVWTRPGQIWFGDVLFGSIGHIDVPPGISVTGRFSSRFWPIDTVEVVGISIGFRSIHGRSGAIHIRGPDVSLRQTDSLPARTYLVGVTGTLTGLLFRASNGASVEVAVFQSRSCEEPQAKVQVLEEGEFPDQHCQSHYARLSAEGWRCIGIACANRGGNAYVETVANSAAEVECARYCQRFSCGYIYKQTPCLRSGCGRSPSCPDECPNYDWCQATTQEDEPPQFNCFCFTRPDAGS